MAAFRGIASPFMDYTRIKLFNGDEWIVQGAVSDVAENLGEAGRGSGRFAWLQERASGDDLVVNPDQVASLEPDPGPEPDPDPGLATAAQEWVRTASRVAGPAPAGPRRLRDSAQRFPGIPRSAFDPR